VHGSKEGKHERKEHTQVKGGCTRVNGRERTGEGKVRLGYVRKKAHTSDGRVRTAKGMHK
jgi:hypothetical protein